MFEPVPLFAQVGALRRVGVVDGSEILRDAFRFQEVDVKRERLVGNAAEFQVIGAVEAADAGNDYIRAGVLRARGELRDDQHIFSRRQELFHRHNDSVAAVVPEPDVLAEDRRSLHRGLFVVLELIDREAALRRAPVFVGSRPDYGHPELVERSRGREYDADVAGAVAAVVENAQPVADLAVPEIGDHAFLGRVDRRQIFDRNLLRCGFRSVFGRRNSESARKKREAQYTRGAHGTYGGYQNGKQFFHRKAPFAKITKIHWPGNGNGSNSPETGLLRAYYKPTAPCSQATTAKKTAGTLAGAGLHP